MKKLFQTLSQPGYTLAFILALVTCISIFFPDAIENRSNLVIFCLILALILLILYTDVINQTNRDLNKKVENHHLTMIQSYERLTQLETEKAYIKLFEDFVKYDSNLFNVQMYKYSIHPTKRNKIDVRINYVVGYTEIGHNLNVMMQGNYTFLKSDLKRLHKIINIRKHTKDDEELLNYQANKIEEISRMKKFKDDYNVFPLLNIIEQQVVKDATEDSLTGAYVQAINDMVYNKFDNSNRRTELVESIIKNEFLIKSIFDTFEYKGINRNKQGRNYYSIITKNIFNEKIIFLFTFHSKGEVIYKKDPDEYYHEFLSQLRNRKLINE
ncbi:hypothetical protein GCM10022378_08490 [Salinicoccus jeotgali]|uniref:Uncharacterized protein n=1 Tax=Salinicoccus jeotgali TaxID=381634 RepID=A0ABP7ELX1_9STAP